MILNDCFAFTGETCKNGVGVAVQDYLDSGQELACSELQAAKGECSAQSLEAHSAVREAAIYHHQARAYRHEAAKQDPSL